MYIYMTVCSFIHFYNNSYWRYIFVCVTNERIKNEQINIFHCIQCIVIERIVNFYDLYLYDSFCSTAMQQKLLQGE